MTLNRHEPHGRLSRARRFSGEAWKIATMRPKFLVHLSNPGQGDALPEKGDCLEDDMSLNPGFNLTEALDLVALSAIVEGDEARRNRSAGVGYSIRP